MARCGFGSGTPRRSLCAWLGWFFLANSLVLLAVFSRYIEAMPRPQGFLSELFLALAAPGHSLTLAFVPALVCFPLALVFPKRRVVYAFTVFIASALVMAVWVDATVFRLFRFHLNGMVWNLITGGAVREVLPITRATWLAAALEAVGVVALEVGLALASWWWTQRGPRGWGARVFVLCACVIAAAQGLHAWADAWGYAAITKQVRFLPEYHPLTVKGFLEKHGWAPDSSQHRVRLPDPASALRYPIGPIRFRPGASRYNLLIVAIEAFRFDLLSPEVTPNIWRLAGSSLRFENHFSSGNCTRFGIFGLFYGLYGPYFDAVLAERRPPLLLDAVVEQGYELGVFASSALTSPEFDRTVFAGVRDRISLRTKGADAVERDRNITGRFNRFLETRDPEAPFFGFLFYDAPHSYSYPPQAPAPFQPVLKEINHLALGPGFDPVPYRNRLKNSLHWVDAELGLVLAKLERGGLMDNTVVVVTGDHGEEFNETGQNYWGHNGGFSRYATQVALVVHWPGKQPRSIRRVTSHVDIAPTLLAHLFGCTTEMREYSNGTDLLDGEAPKFTIISKWNTFAVVQPDRIDVVYPTGDVDTLHSDYRLWDGAPSQPSVMLAALRSLGRFYAR